MTKTTNIPEEDWKKIQELSERIMRRSWEQEEDICNLNNLLHALHGEALRGEGWTSDGKVKQFVDEKWVDR